MVVQNIKAIQKRLPKFWLSFHRKSLLSRDMLLQNFQGRGRLVARPVFSSVRGVKPLPINPVMRVWLMSGLSTVSRCTLAKTQIVASLLRLAQPT